MSDHDCDDMLDVRTLYSEIMAQCLETDTEPVDVLVALTLVLRDLALWYHGPEVARSRSVDALYHSFGLDVSIWTGETLH